jgi:PKD repeat protein
MGNRSGFLVILIAILILAVLSAGCSDTGQSGNNVTTVPTTVSGAKYVSGDIIAKTATSTDTFMLIVKYDVATDKYERALAYKKADGSFYRTDAKTDLLARSSTEKLYLVKITHVSSLSQVPVVTPTTAPPATTATVTTTTTTSYPAPTVSSITPGTGAAGTAVSITSISGTNFRSGASVKLENFTTSQTISGSSTVVQSASNITCYFSIPSTAMAGLWNLTVTNNDGKYGTLGNAFTISNTTVTTTTTTAAQAPTVSSISPASGMRGIQVNITNLAGSNLLNTTTVKLSKSGQTDIEASNITVVSSSRVTCTINLAGAATGPWNVVVTNSGGTAMVPNLFTVAPQPPVASFSASSLTGNAPMAVSFADQSTNSPTTWSWTFGDGNTSTDQSPDHIYSFAGIFPVSLTVTNTGGSNTTTIADYINVSWPV